MSKPEESFVGSSTRSPSLGGFSSQSALDDVSVFKSPPAEL